MPPAAAWWRAAGPSLIRTPATVCWSSLCAWLNACAWCKYRLLLLRRVHRLCRGPTCCSDQLTSNFYLLHWWPAGACPLSPADPPLCCRGPSLAGSARTAAAILRVSRGRHLHALGPNKLLTSCMAATSRYTGMSSWAMRHGACAAWAVCRCSLRWWRVWGGFFWVRAAGRVGC